MNAPEVVWINPSVSFKDGDTEITKGADGSYYLQAMVTGQDSGSGSMMVAKCKSADRLSRWALDGGAKNVRHSYDLTSRALTTP